MEQGENDRDSAVREVYEETGFDIRDLIREEWALEAQLNENTAKMYIIPSVPDNTDFAPRTRKEIRVSYHPRSAGLHNTINHGKSRYYVTVVGSWEIASHPGLPSQLFSQPWGGGCVFSHYVSFQVVEKNHGCEEKKSCEGRPGYETRPLLIALFTAAK